MKKVRFSIANRTKLSFVLRITQNSLSAKDFRTCKSYDGNKTMVISLKNKVPLLKLIVSKIECNTKAYQCLSM